MTNPFSCSYDSLVNISTGVGADENIASDIDRAEQAGEAALKDFMETRLTTSNKDIFSPIKELKLKTFTNVIKVNQASAKAKHTCLKQSADLLVRVLIVSQVHHTDLKDTLKYSLSEHPSALSTCDEHLAKTKKSSLCKHLNDTESSLSLVISVLPHYYYRR